MLKISLRTSTSRIFMSALNINVLESFEWTITSATTKFANRLSWNIKITVVLFNCVWCLLYLTDIGELLLSWGFLKGGPRSTYPRNGSPTYHLALFPLGAGSSPFTLTMSLAILIPSSSSLNGSTTNAVDNQGQSPGSSVSGQIQRFVRSQDNHLSWNEGRKRAQFQWICTGLVAPRGQRLGEHQRRTAWWARHSKDAANGHLVQSCLY